MWSIKGAQRLDLPGDLLGRWRWQRQSRRQGFQRTHHVRSRSRPALARLRAPRFRPRSSAQDRQPANRAHHCDVRSRVGAWRLLDDGVPCILRRVDEASLFREHQQRARRRRDHDLVEPLPSKKLRHAVVLVDDQGWAADIRQGVHEPVADGVFARVAQSEPASAWRARR